MDKIKILGCILIFIALDINAHAQEDDLYSDQKAAKDTSVKEATHSGKPHKLSRKEFLQLYAKDDTSRALIHYYFRKRSVAPVMYVLFTIVSAGEVYVVLKAVDYDTNEKFKSISNIVGASLYTVFFFIPAFGLTIKETVNFASFSRKELYGHLMNYQNGKSLPPKLKRKVSKRIR